MVESDPIRFSPEHVRRVSSDTVREYLVETGIPRVEGFFENGPAGTEEGDSNVLRLGDGGDPEGSYFLDCASGAVEYRIFQDSFFVNSSPQQFAASMRAYMDVTHGELAGDHGFVTDRLRSELREIDSAAVGDFYSFWNDILADVSVGIYGDDPE